LHLAWRGTVQQRVLRAFALREELVAMDETLVPARVEKIHLVKSGWIPELKLLIEQIAALEHLAMSGRSGGVIESLCEMVPTFRPINADTLKQARQRRAKREAAGVWRPARHQA
jgi:hypothetical protein